MSNMSYCRFSNTSLDLRDCVDAMEEAYTLSDMDLSEEELHSITWMRKLCERFLDNMDRFQSLEEETQKEVDISPY